MVLPAEIRGLLKANGAPPVENQRNGRVEITSPLKQVIVVNNELKLPKGKLAAQAAHAAVGAFLEASTAAQQAWLDEGMPKVVLRADSVEELLRLEALALERGLPASLIADAGRTVLPAGTVTCLGLGPAEDEALDDLTGDLKLL